MQEINPLEVEKKAILAHAKSPYWLNCAQSLVYGCKGIIQEAENINLNDLKDFSSGENSDDICSSLKALNLMFPDDSDEIMHEFETLQGYYSCQKITSLDKQSCSNCLSSCCQIALKLGSPLMV